MKSAQEYAAEIRAAHPDLPEEEVRESAIAYHLSDLSRAYDLEEDATPPSDTDFSAFEWDER